MEKVNTENVCIVCDAVLYSVMENFDGDANFWNPQAGVLFSGAGAYGSSYDTSQELWIAVCDYCIAKSLKKENVVKVKKVTQPEVVVLESINEIKSEW